MNVRRKKKPRFVELIVASDLAFLLIIYFIIIAGFNVNMGFLLNLPARDSVREILSEDLLRFDIDSEGRLIHEEQEIAMPDASGLIAGAQVANPNIAVILTIDPLAGWQEVVSFVEIAQEQRVEAFSFTMRRD
ncbi:MAG: biopolymer transporter ExbD [Treponema sp.]|jgi:biopolymer transport protein ExbD|nr:biopolymer transporter ExbD [Treponema sp.]